MSGGGTVHVSRVWCIDTCQTCRFIYDGGVCVSRDRRYRAGILVYIAVFVEAQHMKKILWICLIFLSGCRAHWVSAPAPAEPVSVQSSAMAVGVLEPQDFYFTLISQYEPAKRQVRVIVLAEPALKLADLTVSADQIQLHERAPKVPGKLIRAWGQLAREHFLTSCPARKIIHKSAVAGGTFQLEVTGGICL